jgi:kanamycin kinase
VAARPGRGPHPAGLRGRRRRELVGDRRDPATSAVEPPWATQPATAAAAIGAGLRLLHDSLDPEECPFRWDIETRLGRAEQRLAGGTGPPEWSPEHRHLSVTEARGLLHAPPPVDRLVVCHGDACAPNTLIGGDGRFVAHVDLGHVGVADRWADLAVAAWSTEWNFGPGYDAIVYDAYGARPDAARVAYYRLLWDLS